jgi:hypothetical protein
MQRGQQRKAIRVTPVSEPVPQPNTYLPPTPSTTGPPPQIVPVTPAPPMTTIRVETMSENRVHVVAERRGVSEAGRQLLASAVQIDHDWSLTASSEDLLIAAVRDMSDEDLEGAVLLSHHLYEAVVCVQIRRDMQRQAVSDSPSEEGRP